MQWCCVELEIGFVSVKKFLKAESPVMKEVIKHALTSNSGLRARNQSTVYEIMIYPDFSTR